MQIPDKLVKTEVSDWEYILYTVPNSNRMFFHVIICSSSIDWSFDIELSIDEIESYSTEGNKYLSKLRAEIDKDPMLFHEQRAISDFKDWPCFKQLSQNTKLS